MPRPKTLKTCTFCQKDVYRIAGHGLCAACYYREKRNGKLEYTKVRKPCSIEGCTNLSAAQNMCAMHYRRFLRHGTAVGARQERWGHASSHPLYDRWWNFVRGQQIDVVSAWTEFWAFADGVGEAPSPKHRLIRPDSTKPFGPGNCEWKAPLTDFSIEDKASRAEWQKVWYAQNPRRERNADLKKRYGITVEEFEVKVIAQKGLCAICNRPERAAVRNGKARSLAVDHDHVSGAVRDLLCTGCNSGLGHFEDNSELLKAAAAYLERHRKPPA